MTVNVWETYTDVNGVVPFGAVTGIANYWAFATDPGFGIGTPWGLQRLVVVALIAIVAQAVCWRPFMGRVMGFLVAFAMAAVADSFSEVINAGMFINSGVMSPLQRSWAPQALAYNCIIDFCGALFGTLFCLCISTNPLVQLGIADYKYDVDVKSAKYAGSQVTRKILLKADVVVAWIILPILISVIEWFSFWGIFTSCGTWSVFRVDVLFEWLVTLGVCAIIYGVNLAMADYSAMIVKVFWPAKIHSARGYLTSVTGKTESTVVPLYDEKTADLDEVSTFNEAYSAVIIRDIVASFMLFLAMTIVFGFSWGKILPGAAGFYFQGPLFMVAAILVILGARFLLHTWPVGQEQVNKYVRKNRAGEHQPLFSTLLPDYGFRSAGHHRMELDEDDDDEEDS
jgi:hypothetical protein